MYIGLKNKKQKTVHLVTAAVMSDVTVFLSGVGVTVSVCWIVYCVYLPAVTVTARHQSDSAASTLQVTLWTPSTACCGPVRRLSPGMTPLRSRPPPSPPYSCPQP